MRPSFAFTFTFTDLRLGFEGRLGAEMEQATGRPSGASSQDCCPSSGRCWG